MRLIDVKVDELPVSCWACPFKYNDDFVYRCPFLDEINFVNAVVDDYKKERHPDCPLKVERLD